MDTPNYNDATKILSMVFENLHFLYSLNVTSMPKHLTSHARRVTILTSSIRPTIWAMYALILEPNFYGADHMSGDERVYISEWYEEQKHFLQ